MPESSCCLFLPGYLPPRSFQAILQTESGYRAFHATNANTQALLQVTKQEAVVQMCTDGVCGPHSQNHS